MIGDVLTSSILFEAIKLEYPSAELHYLVNSHTVPVVENNPFIDKLVLFTPEIENSKLQFYRFLKEIRKEKYDIVIDVYSKTSSAFITSFSKAKIRIGKSKSYLNWAYTHQSGMDLVRNHGIPLAYENRLNMLTPFVKNINYKVEPQVFITEIEKDQLQLKLKNEKLSLKEDLVVMVNILGSSPSKTYPLPYLAELLDELVNHFKDIKFLFNYIPKQQDQVNTLKSYCSQKTQNNILNFYAPSLREFIILTSFCDAMIGNEGGAIHMAKAVNIPSFAIFSPWIRKETWGANDEDDHNLNVHLRDFEPQLFKNYNKKDFRKNQKEYYLKFEPELIKKTLVNFIKNSITSLNGS